MATQKKQSFLGGAAILAAGIAIVKVIGALFKIPLYNLLGEAGTADFSNAYNIYAALLTVSTAGLPVALSKMVSESNTLGRQQQSRKIFRVSFIAFLTLGVLSFLLMWFGADWCAGMLHNPHAALGIRALAPAVICVGCLSAFRGYAQGSFRMTPTAVSQILESLCKLLIGLFLAYLLINRGFSDDVAAAGAIMGVTVGTILSLVYMIADHLRHRVRPTSTDTPDGSGTILKRLLAIAVPITLSSAAVSIITLIDTSLVQKQLQNALGYTLDHTRMLYGTYSSGMALYNLPSSLMVALTASVIPTVSAALARQDHDGSYRVVGSSLRITSLLAFPMGFGLWALAEPIMKLIYPKYDSELGGSLLAVLGIASVFVCLMLITNSILQAYGRVRIPIYTMLLGGVVKIALNYFLVAVPQINIHGAPVGTLACFALTALLNLVFVARSMKNVPPYLSIFGKPFLAAGAMAICVRVLYRVLSTKVGVPVAVVGSIAVGVALYVVLVLILKIVTKDDLALLPKGEKVARFLRIH